MKKERDEKKERETRLLKKAAVKNIVAVFGCPQGDGRIHGQRG